MTGFRPDSIGCFGTGPVRTAPVEWFSLSLAPGSAAAANPGYLLSDAQYDPAGRNLPAGFSICYDTRGSAILQAEFRPLRVDPAAFDDRVVDFVMQLLRLIVHERSLRSIIPFGIIERRLQLAKMVSRSGRPGAIVLRKTGTPVY